MARPYPNHTWVAPPPGYKYSFGGLVFGWNDTIALPDIAHKCKKIKWNKTKQNKYNKKKKKKKKPNNKQNKTKQKKPKQTSVQPVGYVLFPLCLIILLLEMAFLSYSSKNSWEFCIPSTGTLTHRTRRTSCLDYTLFVKGISAWIIIVTNNVNMVNDVMSNFRIQSSDSE